MIKRPTTPVIITIAVLLLICYFPINYFIQGYIISKDYDLAEVDVFLKMNRLSRSDFLKSTVIQLRFGDNWEQH
jgi:hypothetical protein